MEWGDIPGTGMREPAAQQVRWYRMCYGLDCPWLVAKGLALA